MDEVKMIRITLACNSPLDLLNDWVGEINGYGQKASSPAIKMFMRASGYNYKDLSDLMNLFELNREDNTWGKLIEHFENGGREEVINYFKELQNV